MTIKENKSLLYIISVAIMSAIMGVSCLYKLTEINNFAEIGPEDAVGNGPNASGSSGIGRETTFNIGVIYPDVEKALKTEGIDITKVSTNDNGTNLTKIWKKLLNHNGKKLYVTFHKVNNGNNITVDNFKNLSYFDFDASGNMIYRSSDAANGNMVKEFVKGVIVKIDKYNGKKDGYVIGGLYKTKNAQANIGGTQLSQIILNYKIGYNVPDGNYEIVYIHPQYSFNNSYNNNNYNTAGFSYAFYGSYNDTKAKSTQFEKAIIPEDYKPLYYIIKNSVGIVDSNMYPIRFYRTR